jgi:histidyl-tRNA synthetase
MKSYFLVHLGHMERISSKTPSGFRDLLPSHAAARQNMIHQAVSVFERFGFSPIDTPALEREEVLTGGDADFSKQLYRARITEDDEPLGLRFDLTVPLARYVAAHADQLTFPFCRYHVGKVWRGEHAQAGRYREFIQCDADIIGAANTVADAHIIATAYSIFSELGIGERVSFRISNRKILSGLSDFLQFPSDRLPSVLRAIDKIEKQGWDAVAKELKDKSSLDDQQIDGIQEFLDLRADSPEGLLDAAHAMLEFAPGPAQGIEELRQLISHLDGLGVPRTTWNIDLRIARGLGYYTGMVFETTLSGMTQFGSVCSGGRYDNLVERFAPLQLSGVGLSIGLDRLFAAMDELGTLPPASAGAKIALLDFDPSSRAAILSLAHDLRTKGIPTALYMGSDESLKGQLGWAVKAGFSYVGIMGSTEHERGVVQLKDMSARTQQEVSLADIASHLK